MREKLNLLFVWEWMLVSEKSRFSPHSFGVSFQYFLHIRLAYQPSFVPCGTPAFKNFH
jgi:hypothetical protein